MGELVPNAPLVDQVGHRVFRSVPVVCVNVNGMGAVSILHSLPCTYFIMPGGYYLANVLEIQYGLGVKRSCAGVGDTEAEVVELKSPHLPSVYLTPVIEEHSSSFCRCDQHWKEPEGRLSHELLLTRRSGAPHLSQLESHH